LEELTAIEKNEYDWTVYHYANMIREVIERFRFELHSDGVYGRIGYLLTSILFGDNKEFSVIVYGNGEYGSKLSRSETDEFSYVSYGTPSEVYNSIAIKSTQGDSYTIDDFYNACVTFWIKVK